EFEIALRGGESDEHRGVNLGGESCGVEEAGEVEPHASQPDAFAGVETVDSEPLCCGVAENSVRLLGGGGVEVAAGGDRGADRLGKVEAGGLDREGVGIDGRDEWAAVDVGAGRAGV